MGIYNKYIKNELKIVYPPEMLCLQNTREGGTQSATILEIGRQAFKMQTESHGIRTGPKVRSSRPFCWIREESAGN